VSAKEKHPHLDNATEEQIAELLEGKTPAMRQLYLDIHRLLLSALPDLTYTTDCHDGVTSYGIRQYGYDGWGMAALAAHSKWVSLFFMRGVKLTDSEGLLEGSGKLLRHVKLRSPEQLAQQREALLALIATAARINL
jgi:hypothetical protein